MARLRPIQLPSFLDWIGGFFVHISSYTRRMKAIYYVYILFRPDGSPLYIGKGKGSRWLDHEKPKRVHNKHLGRIIDKARSAGLEIPKLKIAEHLTNDVAIEYERAWITAVGRRKHGGPLVNQTDGGEGTAGYVTSAKTRSLQSEKRKGKPMSAAHKAAIKAAMSTPESKAKQSAAQKKRFERQDERDRVAAAHVGISSPAITAQIEALRILNTGRKRPPETGSRISASHKASGHRPPGMKGKRHSEESIALMRVAAKARSVARRNIGI